MLARGRRLGLASRQDADHCVWIHLETQAQVDAFRHMACRFIFALEIRGNVTDLRGVGLAGPIQVNDLYILLTENLETLEGLGNLTVLGEVDISVNSNLRSLTGISLSAVTFLDVSSNPRLTSLDSLRGLTFVDGHVIIGDNGVLSSLRGLGDLSAISGRLHLWGNANLASLDALGSLTHVWGGIYLEHNEGLKTLQGLNRLQVARHVTIEGDSPLEVLGGLFSNSSGLFIGELSIDGTVWPRCTAPQEWHSLAQLHSGGHLGASPEAVWESWLSNSCGPYRILCWVGGPCHADLTDSAFSGAVLLSDGPCGPCEHSRSTASVRAHTVANLTGLVEGRQPGNYSLCRCRPGEVGAGPVAHLSILGPRREQHFQCVRGSDCSLHLAGHGLSPGDSVVLVNRCGGEEVPPGRAVQGGDGEFHFADRSAMDAVLPNLYRLCWTPPCSNGSACQQVEVGSLRITGPFIRDESPVALGSTLTVANIGDGVDERDRLRLLPRCGQPGPDGLEAESGKSMIFSLVLDVPQVRVGRWRKCWCTPGPLTRCDAPEHFRVDNGAVQVVCPAEMHPTTMGECRECPIGKTRNFPGIEKCTVKTKYLAWLMAYSLVLLSAFTMVLLARRSMRIEDVSVVSGRTIVKTFHRHGLRMRGKASFPVRFWHTAVPGLDAPEEPLRAVRISVRHLELLAPQGGTLDARLDTSRGFVSLPLAQELWHRGWPGPVLLVAPFLVLAASVILLQAAGGLVPWHVTAGAALALVGATLLRVAVAVLRQATPLDRRIEDFHRVLVKRNPHPVACDRGCHRAVELNELFRVMEFFHAHICDRSAYYMDGNIFGPLTRAEKLSYAELVGPKEVEWFVSHYWGDSFEHMCGCLRKHAEWVAGADDWRQVTYWICFISNNQYEIQHELGSSWKDSSFFLTLNSGVCRGVCMVLDDLALPLTRSWCIFELVQALRLERSSELFSGLLLCTSGGVLNLGQGSVEVAINLARRVGTLDLGSAQTSRESDKAMINDQVMEELGSFEALHRLVRRKMHAIILVARQNADARFDCLFELLSTSAEASGTASPAGHGSEAKEVEDDGRDMDSTSCTIIDFLPRSAKVCADI